ncbi:Protein C39E9.8 c [Aphelenchoides avenae]|nr:Protein C39E9.8 c [Aphelenchus avenae]
MVMRLSLAFFLLSSVAFAAVIIDQVARQGRELITDAEIKGQKIRQCTCAEQAECSEEMKKQAKDCVDSCWDVLSDITDKPEDLRKCFARTDRVLDSFLTCFEENVDACLAERADVMIQKVNISELLRLGVERVEKAKVQLTTTLPPPIRKVVDTAGTFGLCVNDCFENKNAQGFCFDRKDCQALIVDMKARASLRHCGKAVDWKKDAGDLCDCSVKAGIS